jgi:ATP-dependent Clp protease adaptor protein ClpS
MTWVPPEAMSPHAPEAVLHYPEKWTVQVGQVTGRRKAGREPRVSEWEEEGGTVVDERTGQKTAQPPLYKVFLLNDDYTSMEFVVEVLRGVFHKALPEATAIMLHVHRRGKGLCGVYTLEIAETKVEKVHALAKEMGFPLRCDLERE